MRLSEEFNRLVLGRIRLVGLAGLLLLALVFALACGGDANLRQTTGSGADASPVSGAAPQTASEPQGTGYAPASEPVGTNDNPAVGAEPSAAADPGGSLTTAPGAPDVPSRESTRTWATTPGIDPAEASNLMGTAKPDQAPEEMPSGAPRAYGDDFRMLTRGNAEFAFELYRELAPSAGNLFFSPHSISAALAMTYAGARGATEAQMADALRFSLPRERLHPAFNSLDLALSSRGESGDGFSLNVVNAVWGQRGHGFRPEFLDVLAESYGAGVRTADFAAAPEEARVEINDWVADNTEDRITDLVPPGVINPLTRMALTNAVYFKAAWAYPFTEGATRDHPFELLDGGSAQVPMMNTEAEIGYAAGHGYQAVDLPYEEFELSMTVLLPDRGRFGEFEESLNAALVDRIIAGLAHRTVDLDLPRFEFESMLRLSETLKSMGMTDAFDSSAADFSGMDGLSCLAGDDGCLYVRAALHQAFVAVDEEGTEASAATAVVMQQESAGPPRVSVTVDRPFIFLIRDRETGTVLFVGRVTEP